jgi:hypothetical protein
VCRFHFPLLPLYNSQILISLNENKNLQLKAQSIFNKVYEMDMGQFVQFDDFLNMMKKLTY